MSAQIICHVHQGVLLGIYSYLGWNEPALRAAYGESRWAFCLFCRKKKNSITFIHINDQFMLLISILGKFYSPEFFHYLNNKCRWSKVHLKHILNWSLFQLQTHTLYCRLTGDRESERENMGQKGLRYGKRE